MSRAVGGGLLAMFLKDLSSQLRDRALKYEGCCRYAAARGESGFASVS
jgi:hypothetical protein